MSNPLEAIAKKLRGHPCERSIKQTGNEIRISGASVGVSDYKMDIGKFSNKIKEFYKVTDVMVALDNSQYRLCTSVFTMGLTDRQKELVNGIRLQIGLGFDQLLAILGSIEQKSSKELEKKLEEWIEYMGELSKRSIESLNPPTPVAPKMEFKKLGRITESYKTEKEPLDSFLAKTMAYQGISKDEIAKALKLIS